MWAKLPLGDIRVVELGQLLAGPFCGQLLGDFGAEVIKVEQPGAAATRCASGAGRSRTASRCGGRSSPATRSRSPATCAAARARSWSRRLLATADVLVENFRPGTLERWGLAPEELWEINPGLVIVRVTGLRPDRALRPAAPATARSARPWAASVTSAAIPTRRRRGPASRLGDTLAATFACLGALVALHARERTGRGQVVDSAIYEAVLAMMESLVPEYASPATSASAPASILPNVAPSNVYPTATAIMVSSPANQDTVFRRLAEAMGRPELATDERYATHSARGADQAELDALIAEWTSTLDAEDLLDAPASSGGVPAGRIFRAQDMLADPHFPAREAIVSVPPPGRSASFPMQNVDAEAVGHAGRGALGRPRARRAQRRDLRRAARPRRRRADQAAEAGVI